MSESSRSMSSGWREAPREQGLELAGLDDDHLGSGYPGALLGRLREAVPREHQPRARIREVEADLPPLQQHVHRHDHAAGAQHAVVDGAEVRHVREHDPNAVAWLQTPLLQEAGHPGRALVEHVVGEDAVVELQRRSIAVLGCCLGQKLCEVGWHGIAPLFTRPFTAADSNMFATPPQAELSRARVSHRARPPAPRHPSIAA